jgi:hypothetical protein
MASNTTFDNSGSAVSLVTLTSDNSAAEVLDSTLETGLTFKFNLGQFNVDAEMALTPAFLDLATVDISDAHYLAKVSWYADVNKGWHKLFRFKVDSDNNISDSSINDICYYTDPFSWLVGCDFSGIQPVNTDASNSWVSFPDPSNTTHNYWRDASGLPYRGGEHNAGGMIHSGTEDTDWSAKIMDPSGDGITHPPHNYGNKYYESSFNLLASLGDRGPIAPTMQHAGSTDSTSTIHNHSNNYLATSHEDSISKDFLRHMANEVMGGYAAGARRGLVDIFSNEEQLLKDMDVSVNQQVFDNQIKKLKITGRGYDLSDNSAAETANNFWEIEASSNIVQLYGQTNGEGWIDSSYGSNRRYYNNSTQLVDNVVLSSSATQISVLDTSQNMAAVILSQILKHGKDNSGALVNGIDRIDNLLTPNDASGVWQKSAGVYWPGTDGSFVVTDWNHATDPSGIPFGTIGGDVNTSSYDYRRRRNRHDYIELLQAGDIICFVLTINPKDRQPLGRNEINTRKYKVEILLQDAPNVNYTQINNLGAINPNPYLLTDA